MPNATLVQKREELAASRKALSDIFAQAGPNLDLDKVTTISGTTAEKAAEIKKRNDDLATLAIEVENLWEVEKAAKSLDEAGDADERMTFAAKGKREDREAPQKSLGDLFVESSAFKQYNRTAKQSPATLVDLTKMGQDVSALIGRKAVLTTTGFVPESQRTGLIVPGALRRPVVADLIPDGRTNANSVKFMEETTTTNAAAAVAEGVAKPESTLVFTERTAPVRKIATVLPITDELLEDEPAMRSYVEARLRLFLQLAEESQLVSGTGVAPQITGLLNVAGINTQAKGSDPTPDAIYKAMQKIVTTSFLEASGVIIHPNDWTDIRLLRTVDGIYIWGNPADAGPNRIWGLPVVQTPVVTENTAIVAAFDTAMQVFRRNEVSFAVSDQHSDFFILNQLMLRVEERLAFAVYRPLGICTVTGI